MIAFDPGSYKTKASASSKWSQALHTMTKDPSEQKYDIRERVAKYTLPSKQRDLFCYGMEKKPQGGDFWLLYSAHLCDSPLFVLQAKSNRSITLWSALYKVNQDGDWRRARCTATLIEQESIQMLFSLEHTALDLWTCQLPTLYPPIIVNLGGKVFLCILTDRLEPVTLRHAWLSSPTVWYIILKKKSPQWRIQLTNFMPSRTTLTWSPLASCQWQH